MKNKILLFAIAVFLVLTVNSPVCPTFAAYLPAIPDQPICCISSQNLDWDENDQRRDREYQIDKGLDTIGIEPGMVVGEVGAGWGYLAFKLSVRVGQTGKVYAEDVYVEALETLKIRAVQKGHKNIATIVGTEDDPQLPRNKLDLVFMHATIKFIQNPIKLFDNIAPSLKQKGKFIIIEREENRADNLGSDTLSGSFRTRRQYIDLFDQTLFKIENIDNITLPHHTIFLLSVKNIS